MVVSAGIAAVRPDGLLYDFLEFAQVDGSRFSLRNVLVRDDQANLVALHSIGEFDFEETQRQAGSARFGGRTSRAQPSTEGSLKLKNGPRRPTSQSRRFPLGKGHLPYQDQHEVPVLEPPPPTSEEELRPADAPAPFGECGPLDAKRRKKVMAPSHDEVAINRTTIECGRAVIIAANRRPLDWLNFFLADVKDGLGPFLAIFLMSSQHWDAGRIGVVLTIAGVATVVARGPGGALVDAVHWKRTLIAIGALVVAISAVVMALAPQFWPIALAQAADGIADAIFPLAVAAISLGIVGRRLFTRRIGRNEAFTTLATP
jgi:hypothetical protein